jgi:hypothetical protein
VLTIIRFGMRLGLHKLTADERHSRETDPSQEKCRRYSSAMHYSNSDVSRPSAGDADKLGSLSYPTAGDAEQRVEG